MPDRPYQRAVLTRGSEAEHTGGIMNAVRTTLGAGVDGPPPHYHKEAPELFYLLGGALRVLAGEEIVTVERGDHLLVPPLMPHAWDTLPEPAPTC